MNQSADSPDLEQRVMFDIIRWSLDSIDGEKLPTPEELVHALYSEVSATAQVSLHDFVASDAEHEQVATWASAGSSWVAGRVPLPLNRRLSPWRRLRTRAREATQILFTEMIGAARWARWVQGTRVREVEFNLGSRDIARGALLDFEKDLWDGTLPPTEAGAFRLVPAPVDEQVDVDALIAGEPPEHLVHEDGVRYLLTFRPEWVDPESWSAGSYVGSWIDDRHVFLNLDELNTRRVADEVEGYEYPDLGALVAHALYHWYGLRPPLESWSQPCKVWDVRR